MSDTPKINSSPERNTFHATKYLERCEKEGKEPNEDYLNLFMSLKQQREVNMINPEWKKDNLEYDLCSTAWICDKAKASDTYAQKLYAAMCNQCWQRNDVWPILKDQTWGCSWRSAGGIVADMLEKGDYIDWYCSGIGDGLGNGDADGTKGYVPEGHVTEEIQNDLFKLGWLPVDNQDE
jgi:hypothetical protein